jgi:hypothetical protein
MTWWEAVGWIVAVGSGGYGAWRSWRTDRALKLLGEKWRVDHFENMAWIITNRQTMTARDVVIHLPTGWRQFGLEGSPAAVGPDEFLKLKAFRSMGATTEIIEIEWRTRGSRVRKMRVPLPPPPAA